MLSYEEHQILFRLGKYSPETSSLRYSGLNPNWALAHPSPRPPYSESQARRPTNPPAIPFKPLPAAATTKPSDLDKEVLVDDNAPPHLIPTRNNSHGFQPPLKQNTPKSFNNLDPSYSPLAGPPPTDADMIDLPAVKATSQDDEESSDENEEAAAMAERDFALSSPMKQNLNTDVSRLPFLIEISDDFDV
jgi:hypothetical protein